MPPPLPPLPVTQPPGEDNPTVPRRADHRSILRAAPGASNKTSEMETSQNEKQGGMTSPTATDRNPPGGRKEYS